MTSQAPRPPRTREEHGRRAPSAPPPRSNLVAGVLGFLVATALGGALAWSSGCGNDPPPGPSTELPPHATLPSPPTPSAAQTPPAQTASVAALPQSAPSASASAAPEEKPYTGPLLGALALQTPVYSKPEYSKKPRGYIRLGGKVPVEAEPVKDTTGKCSAGWYHLVDGGYVCGRYATLDVKDARVRLGIHAPNLDDVLPYKYAYNTAHGTPLYRSVPSREEMLKYEPYLEAKKKKKSAKADKDESDKSDSTQASSRTDGAGGAAPSSDADAGAPKAPSGEGGSKTVAMDPADAIAMLDGGAAPVEEEEKPWWQQASDKSKPLKVKLSDLEQESDSTLAKRMVKGFFVAVDKTFSWNSRSWYKTTGGLVAPADRMYIVKPPDSQGMAFPEGVTQIGFITAPKASKYEFDADQKNLKVLGKVERFTAVGLTGVTTTYKTVVYRQTSEGWWMKGSNGTYTEPGPRPADLADGEKWIDVNLSRKTLVAFEGDKAVYAALVSPGKKSKNKEKDHSTIKGTFRIREKHIAVTMDGDGRVSSDLPYSIEDVPYVQYFEGSYALHGAFWHKNFGHEMSHGCVNLSPLDAKHIFFWSEPRLPRGWHAVWSTPESRGTLVVVHD